MLALVRLATRLKPRYRKIGHRNLSRAFPDRDEAWRNQVLSECELSIARLVIDFARMNKMRETDLEKFDFPLGIRLKEIKAKGGSILYATGHLGSFELLARYLASAGLPLSFVARQLKPARFDRWWNEQRTAAGNSIITREGAMKGVLKAIKERRDIAILFDQNVTREHAAFVDWFGHPAATTKLVGITAIRARSHVIVIGMRHGSDGRYKIDAIECDFTALYDDQNLSNDQKIQLITERVSAEYQKLIAASPGSWFWMHRRWKTAPEGVEESFYAGL